MGLDSKFAFDLIASFFEYEDSHLGVLVMA